jgi:phosphohistidine swiveling domain-containing protein
LTGKEAVAIITKKVMDKVKGSEWVKRWAGSYTFISCSYWAPHYDKVLKKFLGIGFRNCIFIHKKGTVTFMLPKKELDRFGNEMAKRAEKNSKYAIGLLTELKKNTENVMKIMKKSDGKIPSREEYNDFLPVFERHLAFHNFMKKTVDYLSPTTLKRLLPYFKDARVYSEPVYSESEAFFRGIAKAIEKKETKKDCTKNLLTCLTQEELETYLTRGKLPGNAILQRRFNESVLFYHDKKLDVFCGNEARKIEGIIHKAEEEAEKKGIAEGMPAYHGVVKGICRICPDPFNVKKFNAGDILVTGMTRPEFMPLIKKAAAIVTDVGGVLCHAAIVSREMKKPCIVGTEKSTKIFNDGDLIEVDAFNGIIKRINRGR